MKNILLLLGLCFMLGTLHAQIPFENLEMGESEKKWKNIAKDVSNPNSWEETAFILNEEVVFAGKKSKETQITFWNHRLYDIKMVFPLADWAEVSLILEKKYGKPYKLDNVKKEGVWGDGQKGASSFISGENVLVFVSDNTQKDFHWQDLFQGVLFYVILIIVGLFVIYFVFGYLYTSYCPRCKWFNMRIIGGVELSNAKDYNTDISPLSIPQMEYDKTYTHKCKKCGHVRKDTYSGWWANYRKKND